MREQPLRVIAACLVLDHHGFAWRRKPGQQHRRFDLGGRDRRSIDDRNGVAGAGKRYRQTASLGCGERAGAGEFDRLENALHRAAAQAGIAVEGRGDRTSRNRAHDEPAAGAGIAEVEHATGLAKPGDSDAVDAPGAFAGAFDRGAERPHRLAGVEHVLAFEQSADARLSDRERAENQRPVGDRFVAGHADAPLERARAAGREGAWLVRGHERNGV